MFKRFVKVVKDAAKKVWEFIKSLLPKKPKPKEVEPELEEDIPPEEDPWEPEEAARIAQENKELTNLQASNNAAVKAFKKLFGN